MTPVQLFVLTLAATVSVLGGVALSGCGATCQCPEIDPIEPAVLQVTSASRPELVGAIIDARTDVVEISYSLDDGSNWVVTYDVVSRQP